MISSKEEERKALAKIREIIDNLGENSYLSVAFGDCFDIAEKNIEDDAAYRLSDRITIAENANNKLIEEIAKLNKAIEQLVTEKDMLRRQLDKELEWKTYASSNMSDEEYEKLRQSCLEYDALSEMTEYEAKNLISENCGFESNRIKIVYTLPVYEVNKYKQIRKVSNKTREPLYYSSDWNYIAFECCGLRYEYINGDLRFAK